MKNYNIISNHEIEELLNQEDYASALKLLFSVQLRDWKQLSEAYLSLAEVKTKSFYINNIRMKVQFNPRRHSSTSAKTDSESIRSRKCFLCADNLPEEQLGINYFNKYIFLCNPFPIFPEHFTISSMPHEPQLLNKNFLSFLKLTRHVSKYYSLVYNGPKCGASAPDHLHFQAGTKRFLPVEDDIQQLKNEFGKVIYEDNLSTLCAVDDRFRKIILIESLDEKKLSNAFSRFYKSYQFISGTTEEPLFNILGSYDEEFGWTIIIFLRSKHRPGRFFSEGDDNLLVSPAAIDLGGVLITPLEKDFNRINENLTSEIFNEVSISDSAFRMLIENLKKEFS